MKRLAFVAALLCGSLFFASNSEAAPVKTKPKTGSFAAGAVNLAVGTANFNQRYVAVAQAWVDEPYIFWRAVPDPYTGQVRQIPAVAYSRRLVWLYYDQVSNTYGYFDVYGNPVPYQGSRYRRF